jgi:RNA polymerase sigma-70 factor (ECF subfamily)
LRVRADDEFERFFLAHYESVVRSLTLITGDRQRAEDAAQDAFIKAHARWRTVRSYDLPVAWVRRVAVNRCRDTHRSERRRVAREQPFARAPQVESAEDGVAGLSEVLRLLDQLPPRQRAVSVLFYFDDLPIEEIATSLGLNEGTVKFHLSKARDRMRELLAKDPAEL